MMKKNTVILILAVILGLSLILRFYNLSQPPMTCVDEFYYAPAANAFATGQLDPNLTHHPPLAKEIIGLSVKLLGNYPLGWRIFPVFFSLGGLLITFLLSQEIFKKLGQKLMTGKQPPSTSSPQPSTNRIANLLALLTTFLVAFDFLYFTLSRTGMLDIFMTFFLLLTVFFVWRYLASPSRSGALFIGLALGATLAAKWAGGLLLLLFPFIIIGYQNGRQPKNPPDNSPRSFFSSLWGHLILITVGAVVIYVLSYLPYLAHHNLFELVKLQGSILFRGMFTSNKPLQGSGSLNSLLWLYIRRSL